MVDYKNVPTDFLLDELSVMEKGYLSITNSMHDEIEDRIARYLLDVEEVLTLIGKWTILEEKFHGTEFPRFKIIFEPEMSIFDHLPENMQEYMREHDIHDLTVETPLELYIHNKQVIIFGTIDELLSFYDDYRIDLGFALEKVLTVHKQSMEYYASGLDETTETYRKWVEINHRFVRHIREKNNV